MQGKRKVKGNITASEHLPAKSTRRWQLSGFQKMSIAKKFENKYKFLPPPLPAKLSTITGNC